MKYSTILFTISCILAYTASAAPTQQLSATKPTTGYTQKQLQDMQGYDNEEYDEEENSYEQVLESMEGLDLEKMENMSDEELGEYLKTNPVALEATRKLYESQMEDAEFEDEDLEYFDELPIKR